MSRHLILRAVGCERMQAYKCDRCGKLFAIYPKDKSFHITYKSKKNSLADSILVDLCQECVDSFELWWKEPALAAITNEENL